MQKLTFRLLSARNFRQNRRQLATIETKEPLTPRWYKPEGHETGIRIYNCTARRLVPLVFPNDNYVSWYSCGPTVYDSTHLGHASCYVKQDIIQRILRQHFKFNVVTVMNITDIDDKIINKSRENGISWMEVAKNYETEFWTDMRRLNVAQPNMKVRVSEHIPMIVAFIQNIIAKGGAYVGDDNCVYFNVQKYPIYGKLQNLNLEGSLPPSGANAESKLISADFALWKSQKSADEPAWPSPWGAGRPGWHIECSALASTIFGSQVDIHVGGLDLRFPHHENEEAQSCVYHNTEQWVNYWLHTGQLSVRGQKEKMSKSLKNTISVADMLTKYTADEFRMACVLSNYRNSVDYGAELMETARNTLNRFKSFRSDCQAYLCGKKKGSSAEPLDANSILQNLRYASVHVDDCFKDDFDTARSVSILLDQISGISRCINAPYKDGEVQPSSCLDTIAAVDNFLQHTLSTLGFNFIQSDAAQKAVEEQEVDLHGLLEDLLHSRKIIRDRAVVGKNQELFRICDELRNCLRQHGIEIKDHSQGSSWSFANSSSKK